MSSMRNAVPRRAHRERSQPYSRAKLGLLEKRKDYVLRAQDYKRKRSVLKRLAEKATERNPDEFYFSMVRERTENGVAIAERPESKALSVKEARPLKMQDAAYLRTVRSIELKKIEKLRGLVTNGVPGKGQKILFAENQQEAAALRARTNENIASGGRAKSRDAKELEARIARDEQLKKMERQAVLQVQLMGKGSARKVRRKDEDSDDEKIPVYKWKPQRQK